MGEIIIFLFIGITLSMVYYILFTKNTTFEVQSIIFRLRTPDGRHMIYELYKSVFDKKRFPSKKQIKAIKDTMINTMQKEHDCDITDFHFSYTINMEGL